MADPTVYNEPPEFRVTVVSPEDLRAAPERASLCAWCEADDYRACSEWEGRRCPRCGQPEDGEPTCGTLRPFARAPVDDEALADWICKRLPEDIRRELDLRQGDSSSAPSSAWDDGPRRVGQIFGHEVWPWSSSTTQVIANAQAQSMATAQQNMEVVLSSLELGPADPMWIGDTLIGEWRRG